MAQAELVCDLAEGRPVQVQTSYGAVELRTRDVRVMVGLDQPLVGLCRDRQEFRLQHVYRT
jgi:hypothetical protein